MAIGVVLNITSGVPAPTWNLSVKQAAVLLTLLSKAFGANEVVASYPEDLGYRGFTIIDPKDRALDHATIYKGLVFLRTEKHPRHVGRAIEEFLVDHMPQSVGTIYKSYLQSELSGVAP